MNGRYSPRGVLVILLGSVLAGVLVALVAGGAPLQRWPHSPAGGRSPSASPSPVPREGQAATFTASPAPRPMPTATGTPPPSATPTRTPPPTATGTPTPIPSPTWVAYPPHGPVAVPILLYHHVVTGTSTGRYAVSVQDFRAQMAYLHEQGYQSVPLGQVVEVLMHGGSLPPKAVVITFDDGNADVYTQAFPVLRALGWPATLFMVAGRIGAAGVLTQAQIADLLHAGWELGSHSLTHSDLTRDHSIVRTELLNSRLSLEDRFGVPVRLFAYPFGLVDPYVAAKAQEYGYFAAAGLGVSNTHDLTSLFYLSRREVRGDMTLDDFRRLLSVP